MKIRIIYLGKEPKVHLLNDKWASIQMQMVPDPQGPFHHADEY